MAKTDLFDQEQETSTALTVLTQTYPVLATNGSSVNNLAPGEEVTPFDLERIRVPSGGSLAWEIDGEYVKEFSGIILYQRLIRSYWAQSMEESGGGSAPDCSSQDARHGEGSPGGDCRSCPYSQWGSANQGNGQACKLIRPMFIALPGRELPIVLMAPPSSYGLTKKYLLSLSAKAIPYQSVVTTFSLTKAQSGGGIEYAQIAMRQERVLDADEQAAVRDGIAGLQSMFATEITPDVYDVSESTCEHDLSYLEDGILICHKCKARWSEAQAEAAGLGV